MGYISDVRDNGISLDLSIFPFNFTKLKRDANPLDDELSSRLVFDDVAFIDFNIQTVFETDALLNKIVVHDLYFAYARR